MARLIAHPATLPAAAAALVLAIVAMALAFASIYQSRVTWVTHTLEVERELARFLSDVQDAELGARGYVLTGDEQLLLQFEKARIEAPQQLEKIAQLTSDNPEQQDSVPALRTLVAQKFDDTSIAISQRRSSQLDDAIATFVSGRSRDLMQALNAQVGQIESRERNLMAERNGDARSTGTIFAAL